MTHGDQASSLPVVADTPVTRDSLAADLSRLGVRPGSVMLLHASMKSVGWVVGGPVAVVLALLDVLGPDGTLVVPTHTPDNSEPSAWSRPPVPADWWRIIRATMPAFDPAVTPSRYMGAIAEVVRTWPGARRSDHPQVSFAGLGPAAEHILTGHPLDSALGEQSPLGRMYQLDGDVLLLGIGHGSNTSLHLAEYRVPAPPQRSEGAAVRSPGGGRAWTTWVDVAVTEDDFVKLGADLDATGVVRVGPVAEATARLMRQRDAVDFAVNWFRANR
jgi:aminoglycoside 3-N-acetyltransferase